MLNFKRSREARRWMGLFLAPALLAAGKASGADSTNAVNTAASDPLLDLFVQKGFVTQEEADKVKAEADAMETNGAANYLPQPRWKLSDGLKQIQLFGDIRVRYEDRKATDPADNIIEQDRWRYALRFGIQGDLVDNVYYGFRMETSANPRSPWVTLGQSTSSTAYNGPFGKSTDTLALGQAYIGWHPWDWVDVTLGKMSNPLYTTPMVWDSDINPEGAAERLKYTVGEADFFANFGQFLYNDFNPEQASAGFGLGLLPGESGTGAGQNTDDIFMFAWQGGLNYHITPDLSAKIAATVYNYIGLRSSANTAGTSPYFGDPYVGEGSYYYSYYSSPGGSPGYAGYGNSTSLGGASSYNYTFNQVGVDKLLVIEIPFEINYKFKKVAVRLFGDGAYNLQGAQRAEEAQATYNYVVSQSVQPTLAHSFAAQTHDVKAYQIGIGIGSTNFVSGPSQGVVYGTSVGRHAWELRTYWQHIEQYSLDPNLIDSDFFEGRENMQGIYVALAYAFTPNLIGTVRYGYASRINDQIGTGGSNQDTPWMNPINRYSLLQVDATVRF